MLAYICILLVLFATPSIANDDEVLLQMFLGDDYEEFKTTQETYQTEINTKLSPSKAALLSFLLPGFGHPFRAAASAAGWWSHCSMVSYRLF